MANKYLDLAGLQRLVNKIKELIPTKTSELDNDNGFITIEDIPGGETQITIRYQERFIVGTSSIFEFTKGYYTLNANSVNWYLDGIKQSNDTLIEIDNRTIEVVGGLPEGSTVVFDYVEYTNTVIGLEGVGVEYQWNGTELGVKREDEVDYQYQDLKGEKGDKGDPGEQGPPGEAIADSIEWSKILNKPSLVTQKIITSATEPSQLVVGDQWHKEI